MSRRAITVVLFSLWLNSQILTCIWSSDQQFSNDNAISFSRDVYPIFQRACLECHGQRKQEGGLRLDVRAEALDSGTIDIEQPEASELLRRVGLLRGHDEVMPAIGEPLSRREVDVIRQWIEQGASWPEDFEAAPHWAYVVPQRPAIPPQFVDKWIQSPIDFFVWKRLCQEGLCPSPPAEPAKLVRRLFLDLIGIPPTPGEVEAFVAEPTSARYAELVDDLLNRPQFGERWARPWLDMARYADSHGFQRDDLRDNWAYRDWVIQALNADMPFDQFTIEQLAGDLLPNATESQKIATGFHRCAPTNVEAGSLPEETRVEQVLDRVNTTGTIWLGTTFECCQCHDHKYDPFTIKDYYSFLAFFNSTELEADLTKPETPSSIQFQGPSLPLANPERDRERGSLEANLASVKSQLQQRKTELDSKLESWVTQEIAGSESRAQTHGLPVLDFTSHGTTDTFEKLDRARILLVGDDPPNKDVYVVSTRKLLQGVLGFRLDVLQHESLPGKGPGRGDPVRRNFVLNEFSAELRHRDGSVQELNFSSARASFSQKNWDVSGAIDQSQTSGWAVSPKFDQSHWAVFALEQPLDLADQSELVFTLTQNFGQSRTIGCFEISAVTGSLKTEAVPSEILEIASEPAAMWSKSDRQKLRDYQLSQDPLGIKLGRQIAAFEKKIEQLAADTTLIMVEMQEPRETHVFMRGDYRQPGESVEPRTPLTLHPMPQGPANRLTLAKWLVSPQNPLIARATVNRWWAELFGQGIVTTPEDFGIKGELPTHPELLDWLAVEFMDSGWSMKELLRLIVTSATYQQSSRITPELLERDDRNSLLARGPRLRMDAEMIRDNALAISGLLSLKQFGPPIRPYQPDGIWTKVGGAKYDYEVSPGSEQYRRGVYVVLKRGAPYPSLINFDATPRLACTVMRSRSNTPLQALTLLNDPVYVDAARALAERVQIEQSHLPLEAKIDYAFQLCAARRPSPNERDALLRLYHAQTTASSSQEAWYCIATTLLNLHETITKD